MPCKIFFQLLKFNLKLIDSQMNKIGVFFIFLFSSFASVSQTVDFTFQTSDGLFCNPSIVQFSATASETPKAFIWNFGNGTITNGQSAEVVFSNAGTYNVRLIAVYNKKTWLRVLIPLLKLPVRKLSAIRLHAIS